jgi:hypothetical protein
MTGRRYTNLLFYGSTDPEEFQDFSKTKKTSRVVLEFEDYALDWWKQYYIKNWEDLKKAMRKEFISRKYGLILLRRSENVKQGIKSVQAYYDRLYSSLHRANVVDDMNAMKNFKRGLIPNIITAIEVKYFRSMQDLLSCAIREEKEIVKVQQDKSPRCINSSRGLCAKLQSMYALFMERSKHQLLARREGMLIQKFL